MRIVISKLGLLVVAASAVTVIAPSGNAADDPAAPPVPREGCVTITDPKDDALTLGAGPNEPDLDIVSVVLASPPGKLRAYIKVAELTYPTAALGHQFLASFKLDNKPIEFFAGESDAAMAHDALSPVNMAAVLTGVRYNGVVIKDAKVDAIFDTKTHTVILTTDRAPIETAAKAPLADGTVLTAATARTLADYVYTMSGADTATATEPAAQNYTLGDNPCFAPPVGKLTLTVPASVVSGHNLLVSGVLANAAGTAVGGKAVKVAVAGKSATVTSAADGKFSATFAITSNAGTYPVTATWAGDDTLQTATATSPVVVKIQPTSTALTAALSGTSVIVKATLLNDLRKPVAGQVITWYVDGRAVGTTRTNTAGQTTWKTVKGKTVKASFAGVKNRYAASSASRRT